MKYLPIIFLPLASCGGDDGRLEQRENLVAARLEQLDDLFARLTHAENQLTYVLEIVRKRPVPSDYCEALSDDLMVCKTNVQRLCQCSFLPDDQDMELQMMREEINRRLDEEKAAIEKARAKAAEDEAEQEKAAEGLSDSSPHDIRKTTRWIVCGGQVMVMDATA